MTRDWKSYMTHKENHIERLRFAQVSEVTQRATGEEVSEVARQTQECVQLVCVVVSQISGSK